MKPKRSKHTKRRKTLRIVFGAGMLAAALLVVAATLPGSNSVAEEGWPDSYSFSRLSSMRYLGPRPSAALGRNFPGGYVNVGTAGPYTIAPGQIQEVWFALGTLSNNWVAVCQFPITVTNPSTTDDVPISIMGVGRNFVTFAPNAAVCKASSESVQNVCTISVLTSFTNDTPPPTRPGFWGVSIQNNSTAPVTLANVTVEAACTVTRAPTSYHTAWGPWY
jgi:hypothetical protein